MIKKKIKIKKQRSESTWTILDLSPLSSPFSPSISLLFSPYPYNIPLQVQSSPLSLRSLFSTIFFFCLSLVSLCRLVFGGVSVSWTPPLTDNSLDGTLLCTVQCTAILPQWALGLWWMVRITHTPLGGEWYLPDGGRGGGMCDGLLMRVDRTMSAPGKLGPTGISLVSNLWHGAGCWLCGVCVCYFFVVLFL